ncbi:MULTISPECIES: hypothetical protein [unclassified Rhizobium]|uniref:hypothetical protein n=1 Tax=unclassified Rhizobium TaxID=2613769 RepID=UPI0016745C9F|nr:MULTISPECIES: hypothetical protein [unclassified Rhizobium]
MIAITPTTQERSEGQTWRRNLMSQGTSSNASHDQHDGKQTMTTAFILVALALIFIYAGPTLLYICVGYADYMIERRRHLLAVKHAVKRRSDEL